MKEHVYKHGSAVGAEGVMDKEKRVCMDPEGNGGTMNEGGEGGPGPPGRG